MTERSMQTTVYADVNKQGYFKQYFIISGNSPRVNGHLKFRQNDLNQVNSEGVCGPLPGYLQDYPGGRWIPNGGSYNAISIESKYRSLALAESVRSDADSKLRSQIGGIATNVALLFAERQKTVNTVSARLLKLYRGARAIKKFRWSEAKAIFGNPKRRQKLGKDFNSNWLEFQYGWKPLLGDIYTILDNPLPRVGGLVSASFSKSFNLAYYLKNSAQETSGSASGTVRGSSRIKIWVDGTAVNAISQTGLNNPLLIAWELVPYSFVVDWFFPVGNYLEGLGAYRGLSFDEYSCTQKWSFNYTEGQNWVQPNVPNTRPYQRFAGGTTVKRRSTSGFVLNPFPSFGNGLNLTRFANGLALLAGLFGRKAPRGI